MSENSKNVNLMNVFTAIKCIGAELYKNTLVIISLLAQSAITHT